MGEMFTEEECYSVYCNTNGNPRYILEYLSKQTYRIMVQEITDQFREAQLRGDKDSLCNEIVNVAVTQNGYLGDTSTTLGMCYCIENSGIAAFKPSNILYLYHALHHLKGFNFTLQW